MSRLQIGDEYKKIRFGTSPGEVEAKKKARKEKLRKVIEQLVSDRRPAYRGTSGRRRNWRMNASRAVDLGMDLHE